MINENKLREFFPNTTVFKDQNIMSIFRAASIPSFLRDWIIKKKANYDGKIGNADELRKYITEIIPRREDELEIKGSAMNGGSRKFLARVNIQLDIAEGMYKFEIPDIGIQSGETIIEEYVWNKIKGEVEKTSGGWGLIQLGYTMLKNKGKLTLLEFKSFCPYTIDLSVYCEAREHFSSDEWFDILLGAIDYNSEGYENWIAKHTMLTRLLPFVEPRLNLIELAPKGTGKSYMFGRVGKYGWLVSGGKITRAKMFCDVNGKQLGLVVKNEFVALDEVQTIEFDNNSMEMQGALKTYMESGEFTTGKTRIVGEAGIILLGNIPYDDMDETKDMFRTLPEIFHESALLDRFHGFIKGRYIPRMKEDLKINGWALNTEYFTEIMHLMRAPGECMVYRKVVEDIVDYSKSADTRDTEAILRICTAYLKLLFPHIINSNDMNRQEFYRYCLRPAVDMRKVIRQQLQVIDPKEYGNKYMAAYTIKG